MRLRFWLVARCVVFLVLLFAACTYQATEWGATPFEAGAVARSAAGSLRPFHITGGTRVVESDLRVVFDPSADLADRLAGGWDPADPRVAVPQVHGSRIATFDGRRLWPIVVMRHGYVEGEGIGQERKKGPSDDPLSIVGRLQIGEAGRVVGHALEEAGIPLSSVRYYVGKELRAQQSADAFIEAVTGGRLDENLRRVTDARVNLRLPGVWQGALVDDLRQDAAYIRAEAYPWVLGPQNGETLWDVSVRLMDWLDEARSKPQPTVVFSFNTPMRVLAYLMSAAANHVGLGVVSQSKVKSADEIKVPYAAAAVYLIDEMGKLVMPLEQFQGEFSFWSPDNSQLKAQRK